MFAPKGWGKRWALLIGGDYAVCICAAYWAFARTGAFDFGLARPAHYQAGASVLAGTHLTTLYFRDLYQIDRRRTRAWVASAVLTASANAAVVVAVVAFMVSIVDYGRRFYIVYMLVSTSLLVVWRVAVTRAIFDRTRVGVMVWGCTEHAPRLAQEVERLRHLGYRFLGFASWDEGVNHRVGPAQPASYPIQPVSSIADLTRRFKPDILVLLDDGSRLPDTSELVKCRAHGVDVLDFETFCERNTGRLPLPFVRESWLLYAPGFADPRWQRLLKRGFDIIAAAALAIITLPLSLAVAIAIKLDSAGPVFYAQDRVGLDGRRFRVRKFRSMCLNAERNGAPVWASTADPRATRVGRLIRRLHIDELPQLLAVVRGEMSLVGPRPERPELVAQLREALPYYDYRHLVRPGLTGWAQVCCPYGASVDDAREKLCYDLYYIKNWSLVFELQIILQTVKVVIFGRGAR
jgi:sugar transferase (PEP-CTERM system associated)